MCEPCPPDGKGNRLKGGKLMAAWLKMLAAIGSVAVPMMVLLRDWKFHDRRTKEHHIITRILLIAWVCVGLLAGAAVLVSGIESERLADQVQELVDGKDKLLEQNAELVQRNEQLVESVGAYQAELSAARLRTDLLEADVERARRGFVNTLDYWGRREERTPGVWSVHYGEENKAFEKMCELGNAEEWESLVSLCGVWMEKAPEWPTPYMFAGIANAELGNVDTAIVLLEFVERHHAGDENYKRALELLARLREPPGGDTE